MFINIWTLCFTLTNKANLRPSNRTQDNYDMHKNHVTLEKQFSLELLNRKYKYVFHTNKRLHINRFAHTQ